MRIIDRKPLFVTLALLSVAPVAVAADAPKFTDDTIKIGFISDLSGVYADLDGPGGAQAIRMAIEEAGGAVAGKKIELLTADHQNKADIASAKAREWFDQQGLDLLIGGTNSGANLAMAKLAAEKKKPFISIGAGTAKLTNEECSPYTIHYAYDTVALARGTGSKVVAAGGKSWFFLTADYAFGASLESDTATVVKASGGTVVGGVKHPLNASDFSSYMLQAQASKAQILGLANAGGDAINAIKAAGEFGVTKTMKLAGLLIFITDVHSLGLKATEGMYLTDSWYWNQSPEAAAFARKFNEKMKKYPSSVQAADYSAAHQYLLAVAAARTDDADAVLKHLHGTKLSDLYVKDGVVRPDGRFAHDMYLFQVKAPAESKGPWDYLNLVATIPGDQAFTTKAETKCALWK
jgi:branched-chain amino acid transport system substrate-binding protein